MADKEVNVNEVMDDVVVDEEIMDEIIDSEEIVEESNWTMFKNGMSQAGRAAKDGIKGFWRKHKWKILGTIAGGVIIFKEGRKLLVKDNGEVVELEGTETPLLETEEPVEESKDLYLYDDNTGDFTYLKTVSSETEAQELIDSINTETTEEVVDAPVEE